MSLKHTLLVIQHLFGRGGQFLLPTWVTAYVLAVAAILLVAWRTRLSGRIVSGILALMWLFLGAYYSLEAFPPSHWLNSIPAVLFLAEGILLMAFGVLRDRLFYRLRVDVYTITGAILVVYTLVIYPVLANNPGWGYYASGIDTFAPHTAPVFTLGILLWVVRKVPWYLILIPLVWLLLHLLLEGVLTGYWEDIGLCVVGFVGIALLFIRNRRHGSRPKGHAA